jgi:hypothetical protein
MDCCEGDKGGWIFCCWVLEIFRISRWVLHRDSCWPRSLSDLWFPLIACRISKDIGLNAILSSITSDNFNLGETNHNLVSQGRPVE